MANISFLGLGAMGSRMVTHLIAAGHSVTLWNRSESACHSVLKKQVDGTSVVTIASTPAQAAENADFIISMVRDDTASEYVWLDNKNGVINHIKTGAVAIECSTLTPEFVQELNLRLQSKNCLLVDSPVVGSRPQAEAAGLIFLVGGDVTAYSLVSPILETMAGAVLRVGPAGAGSKLKLVVNGIFGLQLAGIAELMGYLKNSDVDVSAAIGAIGQMPVCSPATKVSAEAMLAGKFAPAFPIELVVKDFSYLLSAAEMAKSTTPVVSRVGEVFNRVAEAGWADDNITAVAKLYL